jgi:hypothetical protein
MLHTQGCSHTLRICNTFCSPTATMVERTRLIVTSHVHLPFMLNNARSLNSSVGIVTRLHAAQPRYRGYIPDSGKKVFCTPKCPHRPWRLTLPHTAVNSDHFHGGKSNRAVKLTTAPCLVPPLRINGTLGFLYHVLWYNNVM